MRMRISLIEMKEKYKSSYNLLIRSRVRMRMRISLIEMKEKYKSSYNLLIRSRMGL